MGNIERAMADAIKNDPSDGDWVVWITPTDAAARALRGLEAVGFKVVPVNQPPGAVEALREVRDLTDPEDSGDFLDVHRVATDALNRLGGQ